MLFCRPLLSLPFLLNLYITNSLCILDSVIGLIRCESKVASLEQRVQAAEEALAIEVKAGIVVAECTDIERCEPSQNLQNANQITKPNREQSTASLEAWLDTEDMVR